MEKDILEQTNTYFERTSLEPVTLHIDGNVLRITCSAEPSDKHLAELRNIIFGAGVGENITVSSMASNLIVKNGCDISVSLETYEIFCGLYKKLHELGVTVLSAEFDPKNVSFTYALVGRFVLNYDELGTLQNIIDPTIAHHDSIRVIGDGRSYTLRAKIS